jgi:hypothetical protein
MERSDRNLIYGTMPTFTWETEENQKNLSQDSWYPGRDFNPEPPS